jgi:hypothetical protein
MRVAALMAVVHFSLAPLESATGISVNRYFKVITFPGFLLLERIRVLPLLPESCVFSVLIGESLFVGCYWPHCLNG